MVNLGVGRPGYFFFFLAAQGQGVATLPFRSHAQWRPETPQRRC